jgi:hypothetical protein
MIEQLTLDITLKGVYINLSCGVIVDVNGKTQKLKSERLASNLKMSGADFEDFAQALSALIAKYEVLNTAKE